MLNKRTVAKWDRQIAERMAGVAKERDKLDNLISDLEALRDSCDRAYGDLQSARDALSEIV